MTEGGEFYVYAYFRPCGTICYIGKGKKNRWLLHLKICHNRRLGRIIAASGGNLPHTIIRDGLTSEQALETEIALISAIGRLDLGTGPLVNLTAGGDGQSEASKEARQKMSVARIGRAISSDCKKKISLGLKASEPAWLHIAKLAEMSRGKPISAAHREKVRLANVGAKRSAEAKAAMSAAQKERFKNSVGRMRPWAADEISRRTWYRRRESADA